MNNELREILTRHVDSGKIPGLVALVSHDGETHVETYGTMQHDGGAPMARDTIFRMASTSKPVAMAATMILLDECRIRLDDTVDRWLPELANRQVLVKPDGPLDETVPANRQITVRDLLTSTFGLGIDFELMTAPIRTAIFEATDYSVLSGPPPHPDVWMRRLGELPLSYQPGERWQYDLSHEVLCILVARVTGKSFGTFLRERVLEPLGMKDTGHHVPAEKIHRLPTLYGPDAETGEFHVWDEAEGGRASEPTDFEGCAMVSTADDYHAFFRMLLNGGTHEGERILSRAAVELMTTNRLSPEVQAARAAMYDSIGGQSVARGWGFGMGVRTHRDGYAPAGQFGWDGGTGTSVYADPKHRLTGILLTQTGMSSLDSLRLIADFWTAAYRSLDD